VTGLDEKRGVSLSTKTVIRNIAPPILMDAARRAKRRATGSRSGLPVWEHVPEGWARAQTDPYIKGWDVAAIRDWHRERFELWSHTFEAPKALGASEYAGDSPSQHLHSHNVHVSFAWVLANATRDRSSLSILDWGGGVGQYYLLARAVEPAVELSYSCKDLPLVCSAGRELNPDVTFYEDEDCFESTYDLVLASNSLQYSEDWTAALRKLAAAADGHLYVAQLPTVQRTPSFVAVQRPYAHGFDTEYLGWIFDRREFLETATSLGLQLEREFFFDNTVSVHGIEEPAAHWGFLFGSAAPPDYT
jgi:putative methyltransferase (TIGR04325 family)